MRTMARADARSATAAPETKSVPPGEPGRRELNKLDKLRRIKEAARHLFVSKGFDDTTIREIAGRAGVGLGTVFVYAEDKRDLLFLIANEGLDQAAETAKAAVHPKASLLDNLCAMFRAQYEFFAQQPALSRLVLREMTFYASGAQADAFQKTREALIDLVGDIVRLAMVQKMIVSREKPELIGWTIFCIYQVELRRWIAGDDLDIDAGLARLGRAVKLFVTGLNPAKGALHHGARKRKSAT